MSRQDEGDRPADLLDAALMTDQQHENGHRCFHCTPNGCKQNDWAQEELNRHPGARQLRSTPQPRTEREKGDPR